MSEAAYRRAKYRINQAYRRRQMSLDLSSCGLDDLPPEIGSLITLKHLYLRNNRLTTLPNSIGDLTQLTHLDLENNRLTTVPFGVLHLTSLQTLDLRTNRLTDIPAELGGMTALRKLYLMKNAIRALPAEFGKLINLQQLDLSDNLLAELLPEIGTLSSLEVLRATNNRLVSIPPEIGQLATLRTLGLAGNRIEFLPSEIGRLVGLVHLHLGKNQLTILPPEIAKLKVLRTLSLNENRFAAIPSEVVRLHSLTSLNFADNLLATLPAEFGWLERIQTLNLENNDLRSVPPEVGQLTRLRRLDLRNNRLQSLPIAFGRLKSLTITWSSEFDPRVDGLLLEGNPLPAPYPSLVKEGQPAATRNVLAWLSGEIDPDSPRNIRDQDVMESREIHQPELPAQGVGPHFEVDEKGVIRFAPPEALDRQGNNVRRLRALHPTICNLSRDLAESLGRGNSPHGYVCERVEAYKDLVDQDLELIDFSLLYVEGVRLANAERAALTSIASGDLPAMELSDREALASLLQLHSAFMMSTNEGVEAIAEEERYRRNPAEELEFRAAAVDLAENLQNNPDVIDQDVASVVLGAAKQIGLGTNLERSAVVGAGTVRNVTIILATGATVALPIVGGLLLGSGGLIAGGLAGVFASEGVKRSSAFGTVIKPLSKSIDGASELELSSVIGGITSSLRPQLNFVLRMDSKLRQLAGNREQFSWVYNALDWIKSHSNDDDIDV